MFESENYRTLPANLRFNLDEGRWGKVQTSAHALVGVTTMVSADLAGIDPLRQLGTEQSLCINVIGMCLVCMCVFVCDCPHLVLILAGMPQRLLIARVVR